MNILIYTTAFAPKVGGVETYVMLLAKGLSTYGGNREKNEVRLVTTTPREGFDDAALPFCVVRRPGMFQLAKLLREADIVQLAGPCLLPQFLGWLFRKRVIVEHHGYQAACPNGLFLREPMKEICPGHFEMAHYGKCLRCVSAEYGFVRGAWIVLSTFPRRWLTKRARQNICVSNHVERRLHLPHSRVIHHGVAAVENEAWAENEARKSDSLVFGYVGRFVAEKSVITLIEAARKLADAGSKFRLLFVGDGPERARLEAATLASGLADKTTFTGYLTGDELTAAVAEISVIIIPTISEETFGLSALEYLAQGKAVVVSDVGGLSEVVDEAGLKFRPGDAADLAQKMQRVMQNPTLIADFGQKGKKRAALFSLDQMVVQHNDLYREVAPS